MPDPAAFTSYLRALFGPGIPSQIWPYPPVVLLLARPFAEIPLGPSFALYTLASLAAFALALRSSGLPTLQRAAILLSPAVTENALAGQNGAIVAALLLGGLLLIDERPILSGLLLGALAMKPQFGLLLPVCMIAGGRWKAAFAGCMSASMLALSSLMIFGYNPWLGFLSSNQAVVSDYIGVSWQADPAQSIFCSAFMAARSLGFGLWPSYVIQAATSGGCAYGAWRLWRYSAISKERRAAASVPLILLAAPWVHTYDMPALAVSIALLLLRVPPSGRILLALAWLWPGMSGLLTIPPSLTVLSIASVAWLAAPPFDRPRSASC